MTVRLRCRDPDRVVPADDLTRAFRDAAGPGDGLEHAYAEISGHDVGVVLFMRAATLDAAEATAAALVRRVRDGRPGRYETLACRVDLVGPFAEAALPPDPVT